MSEVERKSGWKRPGRWIPLFIVALVVLSFTALRIASGSGVKRELEAIRKRGLPVTSLELDSWYQRVPAAENAALAYLDALQDFVTPGPKQDPNEGKKGQMVLGQPLPPELEAAVAAYIGMNSETLEGLHAAAQLSGSRYPIDLSKGPETLLPHLAQVKRLAQLLKWEAIQHSAEGERELAVRSVLSAFALVGSLREEPLLISELVRVASVTQTLQALERVVTEQELTEQELVSLSEAVQRAERDGKKLLWRSMVGERALGIPLFKVNFQEYMRLTAFGAGPGPTDAIPEMLKATLFSLRRALGFQDRDLSFYLKSMGQYEMAATLEYPEMLRAGNEADEAIQAALPGHRLKYLVSGMLLPSLGKTVRKEVVLAGRLRCSRMALAIERYRVQHGGKLPSLHELVPEFLAELPRDPVDDQPLQYEMRPEKGYRIVSVEATSVLREGMSGTNRSEVSFSVLR